MFSALKLSKVSRRLRVCLVPSRLFSKYAADGKNATLELEDGTKFRAVSFGADTSVAGELVFSTGMVGYVEGLTDASYKGQLLMLTYPMIGNYGVPDVNAKDELGLPVGFESDRIHAAALVVQDYSTHHSHWNANSSLGDWLKKEGIPAIHQIDTRMLAKHIRSQGAMRGRIVMDVEQEEIEYKDPSQSCVIAKVSVKKPVVYGKGNSIKILAVDCGIKYNIIRQLVKKGAEVKLVPHDYDLTKDIEWCDGVFLSNGPGDPVMAKDTIANLKKVLELEGDAVKPVFGICLGNQLLSLAAGAKTKKLPFGNRGQNQPVLNHANGEVYITPQNHGYEVDNSTLPDGWSVLFSNINDNSNEGILHDTKPFFTAQFHPEAANGPTDTEFLFDTFLNACKKKEKGRITFPDLSERKTKIDTSTVTKVLVLGSGGLSIGQAGEFDYSGAQAIKALKEEGKEVILMNPNIASVQTNLGEEGNTSSADQVFFLPVTPEYVEEVIKREKPDSILISMGGQTALNCAVEMYLAGVFEKHNVQVLGTPIDVVIATEDRDLFAQKLNEIGEKMAVAKAVNTVDAAVKAAEEIGGFPVMIRSAYALGGLGSGICEDEKHLRSMASKALSVAPQILVERSMVGWKEVEYEVVRDADDNCITVCNMENFDPMGIHTGDSIVMAPSQTLSNDEYHMLRTTAVNVVRHLGIVGECNIQYSLNPHSMEYSIIEVNARLSRSSALASKATGYPLAFVAAKLGLGIPLPKIRNAITEETQAYFEPSLDYVVTKVPRWDLSKFQHVSTDIGSAMKSVGEVMAIGRTMEECFQKALRMTDPAVPGFEPRSKDYLKRDLDEELKKPSERRVYAIAHAMYNEGYTVDKIHKLTNIDKWFLYRLQAIVDVSKSVSALTDLKQMNQFHLLKAKQMGFSDPQIAARIGGSTTERDVREYRKTLGVTPHMKQIDTLAAEYPAQTNYLYATYHGAEHDTEAKKAGEDGIMVLGSGAYRIGSSVEFDWCSVSAIRTLRKLGRRTIMLNYNPETVSTDYDECDELYFEELSHERTMDVYDHEAAQGIIVSVGGQIPNNLALDLNASGAQIIGTSPEMIDSAEDRNKFSALMDSIGVEQTPWMALADTKSAIEFSKKVGYPVLIRPSYVLSGAAMAVAQTDEQLRAFLSKAVDVSQEHPVVISKFVTGAKEVELDAVAKDGKVVIAAIHEHVENAGVHSGDATLLLPAETLSKFMMARVKQNTKKIAKALNITGPFNIQYIVKDDQCMVIECNLRASRSVPFVSKTMQLDFIETATRVMMSETDHAEYSDDVQWEGPSNYTGIKFPMFSFTRLAGADPILGVEMSSTGEVACFGAGKHEAILKAMLSTGFKLPKKGILLSCCETLLPRIAKVAFQFESLGFPLYATGETYKRIVEKGIKCELACYEDEKGAANVRVAQDLIESGDVDLVVSLPTIHEDKHTMDNYHVRRKSVDFGVPLLTNFELVELFAEALVQEMSKDANVKMHADDMLHYYEVEARFKVENKLRDAQETVERLTKDLKQKQVGQ